VPVILKDNIDTAEYADDGRIGRAVRIDPGQRMRSSPEACAAPVPSSSAKATLTEFANFISSTAMPPGYSSQLRLQLFQRGADLTRAGYGSTVRSPADPRQAFMKRPRSLATGGSSSGPGIAVSANLARWGSRTEPRIRS